MSMVKIKPTSTTTTAAEQQANRLHWATALARYTAARRHQLGLTIERAAQLSGLQLSEWMGVEDGWVPEDMATLQAIAGTLRVRWTDYHTLAFFSECVQKHC